LVMVLIVLIKVGELFDYNPTKIRPEAKTIAAIVA